MVLVVDAAGELAASSSAIGRASHAVSAIVRETAEVTETTAEGGTDVVGMLLKSADRIAESVPVKTTDSLVQSISSLMQSNVQLLATAASSAASSEAGSGDASAAAAASIPPPPPTITARLIFREIFSTLASRPAATARRASTCPSTRRIK